MQFQRYRQQETGLFGQLCPVSTPLGPGLIRHLAPTDFGERRQVTL
jgi:hypothetical protein